MGKHTDALDTRTERIAARVVGVVFLALLALAFLWFVSYGIDGLNW